MSACGEKSRDPGRCEKLLPLVLYSGVVAVLILAPFDFGRPRSFWAAIDELQGYETDPARLAVELAKSMAHAALFLPMGPLLAWSLGWSVSRLISWRTILGVSLLAAATEIVQSTVNRSPSVSDFLMDMVGFAAGLVALWRYPRSELLRRTLAFLTRPRILLAALAIYSVLLHVSLVPSDGFPFGSPALGTWSTDYPLSIGNERTRSRAWRGRIERLVIRSRALEPDQVRRLQGPGDSPGGTSRVAGTGTSPAGGDDSDILATYSFRGDELVLDPEGNVREVRPPRGPVLGSGKSSHGMLPAPGGGVEFLRSALLRSPVPPPTGDSWAAGLIAMARSGEFSVEVRFRPRTDLEMGPARIVSCSWDTRNRNFTLGQEGSGLEFRVRTWMTGRNGVRPALSVKDCLAAGYPADVVATYSRGILKVYVNGQERGTLRTNWIGWVTWQVFDSGCTGGMAVGLAFVLWVATLVLLWILLERCSLPPRWRAIAAAGGAAVLLTAVYALS